LLSLILNDSIGDFNFIAANDEDLNASRIFWLLSFEAFETVFQISSADFTI